MSYSRRKASSINARSMAVMVVALGLSAALAGCSSSHPTKKATTTTSTHKVAVSTSTTVPCMAQPSTATAGNAQMKVDPGTCLTGGETVTITGSGLKSNSPGGISECNDAANQPTIAVEGSQVPVSCTSPLDQIVSTSSTGTLNTTFKIVTGYPGPPSLGTDSAGTSALKAALSFPCPPTPAQAASGATCTIAFGDAGGDQLSADIGFAPDVKATATRPGTHITPSL